MTAWWLEPGCSRPSLPDPNLVVSCWEEAENCLRANLDRARRLEQIHPNKAVGDTVGDGDQAVIAQHQIVLLAEVSSQTVDSRANARANARPLRLLAEDGSSNADDRSGEHAKATDPSTWSTFDRAVEASRGADGIGYVFAADDPMRASTSTQG